jgi:biopolymer transport protein ExbD
MSTNDNSSGLTAEPNVTPMIDVLLVLLIIFMIIVPMSRKAVDVQLPDPTPQPNAQPDPEQIVLEVAADGSMLINKQPIPSGGLDAKIRQVYDKRPTKILFVKGDPKAKYQTIIHAMDVARGAGVVVIGVPPKDAAQ